MRVEGRVFLAEAQVRIRIERGDVFPVRFAILSEAKDLLSPRTEKTAAPSLRSG
jgi:hypothetical protein